MIITVLLAITVAGLSTATAKTETVPAPTNCGPLPTGPGRPLPTPAGSDPSLTGPGGIGQPPVVVILPLGSGCGQIPLSE